MSIDWKDTIVSIIQEYMRDYVYGPIPGRVVNVSDYNEKQLVDVEIDVSRLYVSGKYLTEKGNTIYGVPVVNPGAGGGVLTLPIKKNDKVLLVFGLRDMDSWKLGDGSEEARPYDSRYMSKTDAIAIPGLCTQSTHLSPNPDNVELKFRDCLLSMKPDGTIVVQNGSCSITLNSDGSIVETNGAYTVTKQADGVVNINGFIINVDGSASSPVSITAPDIVGSTSVSSPSILADSVEMAGHTHTQPNDSDGDTQQPTNPAT